uniref:Glycoside hydrolase family 28 n=1 Tax=Aretaon asperrimus TaxID=173775 RepID=A0A191XSV8_9NEOP|nr:glycoside hydrolase family 28 [Aretaon asperrimus]
MNLVNMQRKHSSYLLAFFTSVALMSVGTARDLRDVTEPKIPPSCTTLKASGGDDTETIQKALDSCTKGKAVALSPGVFHSGPLNIPSGVGLVVDTGVTLKAITDPALYDLGAKTCGTVDDVGVGCKAFITMLRVTGSGLYGKGTIDGQGNVTLIGQKKSWWDLSEEALVAGTFQNVPRLIQINNSADITMYQLTLIDSPFYFVTSIETNGFTAWGLTIIAPASARNTDGIDPIGSQNVTIAHCNIRTGDDSVAIKAMTAPSRHISVLNSHFGHGNGMSIGSEVNYGASDVLVSGLTLNGSLKGAHIKSNTYRGGHVVNITYNNVCIVDVKNPIYLEMDYVHLHGNRTPEFRNIAFNNIRVLSTGIFILQGLSDSNPVVVSFNDVHITKGSRWSRHFANVTGTWEEDASGHCGYAGNE